jgi:hypothetical protein
MTLPPYDRLVRNWRYRSAEMRAISETMKHQETRATMERLADSYDEMADNRERRLLQEQQLSDQVRKASALLAPE